MRPCFYIYAALASVIISCGPLTGLDRSGHHEIGDPGKAEHLGDSDGAYPSLYGQVVEGVYLGTDIPGVPPVYVHKINLDRNVRIYAPDATGARGWSLLSEQRVTNLGFFYFDDLRAEGIRLRIEVVDSAGEVRWAEEGEIPSRGRVSFLLVDETKTLSETKGFRFIGVHMSGRAMYGDTVLFEDAEGQVRDAYFDTAGWAWVVQDSLPDGTYSVQLSNTDYGQLRSAPVIECFADRSWSLTLEGQGAFIGIDRPDVSSMHRCSCVLNCNE